MDDGVHVGRMGHCVHGDWRARLRLEQLIDGDDLCLMIVADDGPIHDSHI